MNEYDYSNYAPSLINSNTAKMDCSLTQESVKGRFSLSLRRSTGFTVLKSPKQIYCTTTYKNKENTPDIENNTEEHKVFKGKNETHNYHMKNENKFFNVVSDNNCTDVKCSNSLVPMIKYDDTSKSSDSTIIYEVDKPQTAVCFGLDDFATVNSVINPKKRALKNSVASHKNNDAVVACSVLENSNLFDYDNVDENLSFNFVSPSQKEVVINSEIKETKLSSDNVKEKSKIHILNTNVIEKLNYVEVQPPNYKSVKRKFSDNGKLKSRAKKKAFESDVSNGSRASFNHLKQIKLDSFFKANGLNCDANKLAINTGLPRGNVDRNGTVMIKKLDVADAIKFDRVERAFRSVSNNESPRSAKVSPKRNNAEVAALQKPRNHSASSHSPRKNVDSVQFSSPSRCQSNKTTTCQRIVPHHKIVAGTHFAVDAFSYGDIPNVNHYFLTHFHSDHYSGLKKGFKKMLFCSKITADLCVSRLRVNSKYIHVLKINETIKLEGVEVTALEANHCPGAIMLVFTLPNGKNLLHTGDFRASPIMESNPIFWNKDIHTIYLDTTYCNPRYDFPTQDESLELALNILREKKLALENAGKKFSSVLIICGTYTIGKEKFFLGMARRVGCSVWASSEKDRILQMVEGRSFSHGPPHSCQLHLMPMKDITHEKLRSYLDSLQGAFSEVVAFKPSGWENGKNSSCEKDSVSIHGIPYSEHSSFSEMIRFVKFLKPKQVIPTVDISGGVKAVQKYFPCPLVYKEDIQCQSKLTDYFNVQNRQQSAAVT